VGEDLTAELEARLTTFRPTLPKRRPTSHRWSRLETSYCKDGSAAEIGGCKAIVVDASVGADTTMWAARGPCTLRSRLARPRGAGSAAGTLAALLKKTDEAPRGRSVSGQSLPAIAISTR